MLQAIALNLVGSIHDAEDIVQDTFLKWLTIDNRRIENTKAYLVKSVTNNCINHLNALKAKNKISLDHLNLKDLFEKIDLSHLDIKHEVSVALSLISKKLGPLEKAIFLLREVFDVEYDDLQEIFNKKKEHCRQVVCRAKQKLMEDTPIISIPVESPATLIKSFKRACSIGHLQELIDHLRPSSK